MTSIFNYERAKNREPVYTEDGKEITILQWDMKGFYNCLFTIMVHYDSKKVFGFANSSGEYTLSNGITGLLMMNKVKYYVNVFGSNGGLYCGDVLVSEEAVDRDIQRLNDLKGLDKWVKTLTFEV